MLILPILWHIAATMAARAARRDAAAPAANAPPSAKPRQWFRSGLLAASGAAAEPESPGQAQDEEPEDEEDQPGQLRWSPVSILAIGPCLAAPPKTGHNIGLAAAGAEMGGAGAGLSEASAMLDDGRLLVSASGCCFVETGSNRPPVVLTCAAALAPFLGKRRRPAAPSSPRQGAQSRQQQEPRFLRPVVDVPLVPITEIFVLYNAPPDTSEEGAREGVAAAAGQPSVSGGGEGGGVGDTDGIAPAGTAALAARLMACVPVAEVEETFGHLVAAGLAPPAMASTTAQREYLRWRPPAVGSLGIAVLHVICDTGAVLPEPLRGWRLDAPELQMVHTNATEEDLQSVHICASAFGALRPSLFLDVRVQGAVAAGSLGAGLLLVDAVLLPGAEGGVVTTAVADDEDWQRERQQSLWPARRPHWRRRDVPIAIILPPLRCTAGNNAFAGLGAADALAAAVPLCTVGEAIAKCLPGPAVAALLGPRLREALCGGRRLPEDRTATAAAATSTALDLQSPPSGVAVAAAWGQPTPTELRASREEAGAAGIVAPAGIASSLLDSISFLVAKAAQGDVTAAAALAVSPQGHVLTSARFVRQAAKSAGSVLEPYSSFACEVHSSSVLRGGSAPWPPLPSRLHGTEVSAVVVHVFEGLHDTALLLLLRRGWHLPSAPLPWCMASGVGGSREARRKAQRDSAEADTGHRAVDTLVEEAAFEEGTLVWSLSFAPPTDDVGWSLSLTSLLSGGLLTRVASGPGTAWDPQLVEGSFTAMPAGCTTATAVAGSVLLHHGPQLSLLGLVLRGSWCSEPTATLLPRRCLAVTSRQLTSLLRLPLPAIATDGTRASAGHRKKPSAREHEEAGLSDSPVATSTAQIAQADRRWSLLTSTPDALARCLWQLERGGLVGRDGDILVGADVDHEEGPSPSPAARRARIGRRSAL